jgi:hypothetical protein
MPADFLDRCGQLPAHFIHLFFKPVQVAAELDRLLDLGLQPGEQACGLAGFLKK